MNSKHFTPRKKKIHAPSVVGGMKRVRIDARTEIMVLASVPDEEAREKYLERINKSVRGKHIPVTPNYPVKEEFREIQSDDVPLEELAEVLDEVQSAEVPKE
jgi:hypothetical protein